MVQVATILLTASAAFAIPLSQEPFDTIIPGETELYDTYRGKAPPFPGNITTAILATSNKAPATDDVVLQNLAAAEWIIYSFYQQGAEAFNTSSFTKAGYPNNTYDRLLEIRDNEAGHLNAFYDAISNASIKPGPCKYNFNFATPKEWLELQLIIEISSMVFVTGLVQEAKEPSSHGLIASIGESETRHNAWAQMQIWDQNPFGGPIDTIYPYATHILFLTTQFVVEGTCAEGNPEYPSPKVELPFMEFDTTSSQGHPGDEIAFKFSSPPAFCEDKDYYAVYYHGLDQISVPFDHTKGTSRVPAQFEAGKGVILVNIADAPGAPTIESVVTAPLILLQQPGSLTTSPYTK